MSRSVLAGVGAVVTAFVAAGVKQPPNVTAFRVVLLAYVAYLVVVPGALGLAFFWGSFQSAEARFQRRRGRHQDLLGALQVEALIGDTPENAKNRFVHWFLTVIIVYGVFAIGMLVLTYYAGSILK